MIPLNSFTLPDINIHQMSMPSFQTLALQLSESILTISLNRPDQMNAFTVEMANELVKAFQWASEEDAVRVIVLTGSGKAFCAGMDLSKSGNVFGLNETLQPTIEDMTHRLGEAEILQGLRDTGGRVTLSIFECKKPVIAAINGAAVGIGATMTLAADIRLMSEKARVGFVFGKIGITPEACSTWFLPRIVGISRALEWCYSGDILSAEEALAGGLIKEVCTIDDLLPRAYELARKFSKDKSPVAVALTRQMMYRNSAAEHPMTAHQIDSLSMFYTSIGDGKEGVRSFLEKRAPEFTSKASTMPPFYPWWE
jgi:enoyl-CoA hydratase/carnithine racemase